MGRGSRVGAGEAYVVLHHVPMSAILAGLVSRWKGAGRAVQKQMAWLTKCSTMVSTWRLGHDGLRRVCMTKRPEKRGGLSRPC